MEVPSQGSCLLGSPCEVLSWGSHIGVLTERLGSPFRVSTWGPLFLGVMSHPKISSWGSCVRCPIKGSYQSILAEVLSWIPVSVSHIRGSCLRGPIQGSCPRILSQGSALGSQWGPVTEVPSQECCPLGPILLAVLASGVWHLIRILFIIGSRTIHDWLRHKLCNHSFKIKFS